MPFDLKTEMLSVLAKASSLLDALDNSLALASHSQSSSSSLNQHLLAALSTACDIACACSFFVLAQRWERCIIKSTSSSMLAVCEVDITHSNTRSLFTV